MGRSLLVVLSACAVLSLAVPSACHRTAIQDLQARRLLHHQQRTLLQEPGSTGKKQTPADTKTARKAADEPELLPLLSTPGSVPLRVRRDELSRATTPLPKADRPVAQSSQNKQPTDKIGADRGGANEGASKEVKKEADGKQPAGLPDRSGPNPAAVRNSGQREGQREQAPRLDRSDDATKSNAGDKPLDSAAPKQEADKAPRNEVTAAKPLDSAAPKQEADKAPSNEVAAAKPQPGLQDKTQLDTGKPKDTAFVEKKPEDGKITGGIGEKLQTAFSSASAEAVSSAIVSAGRSGKGSSIADAAAKSIVDVFGKGVRGDTAAEAFAASAAADAAASAIVFAKAAAESKRRGYVETFGKQCARGFSKARKRGDLEAYTIAISQAIDEEDDDDVVEAYGVAFAQAFAAGGDDADALAEATAIAYCKKGKSATAFAKAYSIALSRNKNGCLVLTKAKAIAVARCGNGFVEAYAEASVERRVLGLCGILEELGIDVDRLGRRL